MLEVICVFVSMLETVMHCRLTLFCYLQAFAKHFRDTVDILVGWHIDHTQQMSLTLFASGIKCFALLHLLSKVLSFGYFSSISRLSQVYLTILLFFYVWTATPFTTMLSWLLIESIYYPRQQISNWKTQDITCWYANEPLTFFADFAISFISCSTILVALKVLSDDKTSLLDFCLPFCRFLSNKRLN